MHVFVTGGTGFFDKALLRHWAGAPEVAGGRFTLLSRDPDRFRQAHGDLLQGLDVQLHRADVMDPESLPAEASFTHMLHAATDASATESLTAMARFDQIVQGTRNLLELARQAGRPRVLVTSSGGVYASQPPSVDAIAEGWNGMPDPLEPRNAYAVAKRQAEHLCALYHDAFGLNTVIARCFALVGEDLPLDAHFAIGNFIRDAAAGRPIVIQGDGTPIRSWLDQRDLAHWLTYLIDRSETQRAYNVGSDVAWSMADAAALVQRCAGSGQPVLIMGQRSEGQSAARSRYVPDISRIRNELGLTPEFSLEDSVLHVLRRARSASVPFDRELP